MRRSPLLLAAFLLTGCATLSGTVRSYMTTSDGLQIDDHRVRALLQNGKADSAFSALLDRRSSLSPDDQLLRLLYQGTAARYAGNPQAAGALFDKAFSLSEDRYTKSVGRTAAAMLTNDYALPYTAGRNERLLLHYNAILAWSAAGDADAAAVEARRLVALLARFGEPDDDERDMRAMLHAVAAAAFEQAADWSDADVARRNAARLGAAIDTTWSAPQDSTGDLVIIVERGDVAHKVAVGLTLPIYNGSGNDDDGAGGAAQRLLADFGTLRNGGVWYDDVPSWRFNDARYGSWRGAQASYLLDMSWPVLRRAQSRTGGSVQVHAVHQRHAASVSASLSDALAADYRRDRSAILSRTVARAVTKYLAARAAEAAAKSAKSDDDDGDKKRKDKKDNGSEAAAKAAGMVARLVVNAAGVAMERADTRAWALLPGSVSVTRMRLPAGSHELVVDAAGVHQLNLPGVVVRAGRTTVVSARLWREMRQGVGQVVEGMTAGEAAPQR